MHYIEYNVLNGVMAQTYWQGQPWKGSPWTGLLTYFLPMKAGSKKDWAGEMDSFFCCHGTMVQANAAWNRRIYYKGEDALYITMYTDSEAEFEMGGLKVKLTQRQDYMNGSLMNSSVNSVQQTVNDITATYANKPDFRKFVFTLQVTGDLDCRICLRIPDWVVRKASVYVNDELVVQTDCTEEFLELHRIWKDGDRIILLLPVDLRFIPLPDDAETGAFCYGPDVLAGITEQERVLRLENEDPVQELSADTEREWGAFRTLYRTENQDPGISFRKLNEIGYEPYQMYFKVKRKNSEIESKKRNQPAKTR